MLHLLEYAKYAEAVDVPPAIAQEGIAQATWIDLPHFAQYVRPLLQEGLARERMAHVKGVRQRRKVYDLTEAGRLAATRLRENLKREVVRIRDAGGAQEAAIADVLQRAGGKATVLEVVRHLAESDVVDLAALGPRGGPALVEMLAEAPRLAVFVGRHAELEAVTQEGGPRLFVVRGVPGIGKSSFGAKACEALRGTRNLYWHRIRPWDTRLTLLAGLGDFLAVVGKPGLRSVLARGETGRGDQVLRADLPGTKAFLVFDDAHEGGSEVLSFLRFLKEVLAEVPDVRVLVLTRRALPVYDRRDVALSGHVREVELAGLGADEVNSILAERTAPDLVDLGRQLGGHPLFLELLRSTPSQAARPSADIQRFIEEEIYAGLREPERKMMKAASLYLVPVPRDALFPDPTLTHDVLLTLADRSLLRPVGDDAYLVHDTIRDFFASVLAPAEREGLAAFAVAQLRRLASEAERAHRPLAGLGYLQNALQLATSPEDRAALWEALGDTNERIGDFPGMLTAYKEALQTATKPEAVARVHRKTASALQLRGELHPALSEIDAGIAALGDRVSAERGWLDLVRCRTATKLEEWAEAREHGSAALNVFRSSRDLPGQAHALLALGGLEVESQTGDPRLAERYLTEASALASSVEDPEFTARVHIGLAHLYGNRFGDVERATAHILAAEALGESGLDPHTRRSLLMLKAWFHLDLRADYDSAEEHFTEAMTLGRRIHSPGTVLFARYGLAFVRYFRGEIAD
ncbi:MAG: ATP-binding protein, partial [Euryarchaeota archaeon]|nr:ATP-binding protein [Euryarchaeota archaeon]